MAVIPAMWDRQNRRSGLKEYGRRNLESFAQFLNVGFVKWALLVKDFGYDALRAKDWRQIFLPEMIGLHQGVKDF